MPPLTRRRRAEAAHDLAWGNSPDPTKKKVMSESSQTSNRSQSRLWRYALAAALAWTVFIAATVGWNMFGHWRETLDNARQDAQISFQKEMLFRLWAAGHGDGDAPATNNAPSSPRPSRVGERALPIPPSMMRQAQGHGQEPPGPRSHLAGLKPSRPENAPDAWETRALKAFGKGETEVASVEMIAGQEYMRVMRPLVTEAGCLTCHSAQDYKVGDIRGGMSVSVPLAPLWSRARGHLASLVIVNGVIWLMGLGGIGFGARRVQTHNRERAKAIEALREQGERFRLAAESATDVIYEWDIGTRIQWFGKIDELMGYAPGEFPRTLEGWANLLHPEDRARVRAAVDRQLKGEAPYNIEYRIRKKDGAYGDWWARGTVLRDAAGKPHRWIGAVTDVTERKQAEQAMEQSRAAALNMMEDAIAARDQAEQTNTALRREMAERKRAEEALRKSHEHFRRVIEDIFKFVPEALLVFTRNLNLQTEQGLRGPGANLRSKAQLHRAGIEEVLLKEIQAKASGGDSGEIRFHQKPR